jgi:hypothetical protein
VNRELKSIASIYGAEIKSVEADSVILENTDGSVRNRLVRKPSGFYEPDQEFEIYPGNTYRIRVIVDGCVFYSSTTVPELFAIRSVINDNTVSLKQFMNSNTLDSMAGLEVKWQASDPSAFYRISCESTDALWPQFLYTYGLSDTLLFPELADNQDGATTEMSIDAFDKNYANLFYPQTTIRIVNSKTSPEWEKWFDEQSNKSLAERSSITGRCSGLGFLGSLNTTKVSFVPSTK